MKVYGLILVLVVSFAQGCASAKKHSESDGQYASVNGLKLYYEIHGQGEPLVLLHGGGSTIQTTFGKILPLLSKTHQVIAIEEQGHGHTADIDRPLTFEQSADDVAALLKELKIPKADVMGFSNGANTAMQLAIRHSRVVRKLVVASGFYKNAGLYPAVRESFRRPPSVDSMPKVLKDAYLASAPHPEKLPVLVTKLMKRLTSFKDWKDSDIRSIECPTLIMMGDHDLAPVDHAVQMYHLLPIGQLAILPGGHGAYIGEVTAAKDGSKIPELSAAMIDEFLSASVN